MFKVFKVRHIQCFIMGVIINPEKEIHQTHTILKFTISLGSSKGLSVVAEMIRHQVYVEASDSLFATPNE